MKKLLVVLVSIALVAWVISWFRTPEAVATAAAKPWPGGGALSDVNRRVTPKKENDVARKLATLTNALPQNDAVVAYVRREVARDTVVIGHAPALADISLLRELLLREQPAWNTHEGLGDDRPATEARVVQMTAARWLVASALAKGSAHDVSAWEDLHAVDNLSRALAPYPQVTSQTAAFTMDRMINAVAWKMPLPPPAWFAEMQQRDAVQRMLPAFQHQAASYWQDGSRMFPTKFLANSVEHDRAIAESLAKETRCDVKAPSNELGVDLSSVWRRAFRYRAELEATANALRAREGKPIETKSRCSDGVWTFDGSTLRFSHDIATEGSVQPMPLVLHVEATR